MFYNFHWSLSLNYELFRSVPLGFNIHGRSGLDIFLLVISFLKIFLKINLCIWLRWISDLWSKAWRIFDLCCGMQILNCSMWDLVLWPGFKPGPLPWDLRVLATGPERKSLWWFQIITNITLFSENMGLYDIESLKFVTTSFAA